LAAVTFHPIINPRSKLLDFHPNFDKPPKQVPPMATTNSAHKFPAAQGWMKNEPLDAVTGIEGQALLDEAVVEGKAGCT